MDICLTGIYRLYRVWEEVKASNHGLNPEELSQMEADYRQTLQQSDELGETDVEYLKEMNDHWNNGYGLDMDGLDNDFGLNTLDSKMTQYDEFGVPKLEQYAFGEDHSFHVFLALY